MTMVPVYLHVFIDNSYLCIVLRTDEVHSIIFSVMIVIIVITIIIMIKGITMVPCNHSSDISFLPSAVPSFLLPRLSSSHSLLRAYRQHSLNHQKPECLPCAKMGGKSSQVFPRSVPVVFQNYYKYLLPLLRFQNLLSSQMGGKGSPLFP